jgi:predicted Zn-dependent protease
MAYLYANCILKASQKDRCQAKARNPVYILPLMQHVAARVSWRVIEPNSHALPLMSLIRILTGLEAALIHNTLKHLFFLLLLLTPFLATAEESALPELGDSSATSLTPEQERQIGSEVMQRMRRAGYIISDPLISSYLEQLGRSLAVHTHSDQDFTFFVVDAPTINAFALPGGFIGIHSGLILASHSESELASVVAHEIAHITQHHLARGVEQANRMQLPLSVALIAAILLSGGDPNVANAAMAASLGGSQQMQLNFTRANEQEADRVGMQLLADTDFAPQGMAAFFSRLQEESRYYGEGAPEFLRTHPVTTARLAEAQSAAERYPHKMRIDTAPYHVAKARIRLHHSKSATALMKTLESEQQGQLADNKESDSYLRAITHIALQQPTEAGKLLQQLVTKAPESIAYRETLGQLHHDQGAYDEAVSLYRNGLQRYPHNEMLALSLAKNLLALHQYPQAREPLQEVLRRNPRSASAYTLLAQLESEAGNQAAAHLAQAEHYRLMAEPHSALDQLKIAKRIKNLDFYHASRIDAFIKEVEESLEKERKQSPK